MKKICVVLAVLLVIMWPEAAFAEGETLAIDNDNIYTGMNKPYKEGYNPAVADGKATIILPLIASGEILGNAITVTPNLGDTHDSPFVISNYQKTVYLNDNAVGGGGTVSSYLVRFDLPLASGRINGAYPVTIDVLAADGDGGAIRQSFTVYVTIKDGKNANTQTSPKSQPKIIVGGYKINPSPVMAGEDFTAVVTLRNTSETQGVQNMAITVSADSPNFELLSESSTFYIGKLAKGKTTQIEIRYSTDLETPAQRHNISLSIEYDNSDAITLCSSGTVTVTVGQPLRVRMEAPRIPAEVNAGDTIPLAFYVMNLSRGTVYNVRVTLSAPGLIPIGAAFIGNMEAGTAMVSEMDVFVGTKDMTEGCDGEDKYGCTNGRVTLVYEDGAGHEYTEETEISATINPPVILVSAEREAEPEKAGQWWISILIGAAVAAGLTAYIVARGKRGMKNNEEF